MHETAGKSEGSHVSAVGDLCFTLKKENNGFMWTIKMFEEQRKKLNR